MNFLTSFSQAGEIEFRFEDLQFKDNNFSSNLPNTKKNDKIFFDESILEKVCMRSINCIDAVKKRRLFKFKSLLSKFLLYISKVKCPREEASQSPQHH